MRELWHKIRARGLTPQNVASYVWLCVYTRWCDFWGTLRLRCKAAVFGVRLGRDVRCCGPLLLARWPGSMITLGNGVHIISTARRATAATIYAPTRLRTHGPTASIFLAEGVELTGTSITARSQKITVGRHTLFGPNCIVVDADFHALWPPERRHIDPGYEGDAPVTIGAHVWVGMNCIILKGVNIGDGAVIGAGSVVTRDIPAYTLAVGSPARVVRKLEKNISL